MNHFTSRCFLFPCLIFTCSNLLNHCISYISCPRPLTNPWNSSREHSFWIYCLPVRTFCCLLRAFYDSLQRLIRPVSTLRAKPSFDTNDHWRNHCTSRNYTEEEGRRLEEWHILWLWTLAGISRAASFSSSPSFVFAIDTNSNSTGSARSQDRVDGTIQQLSQLGWTSTIERLWKTYWI